MREVDILDLYPRPSDSLPDSERTKHRWYDYGTNYGDDYRCQYCNIPQYDYRTGGRIVETEYCEDKQWAHGGDNAGNLLLAHHRCNTDKSDQPPSERTLLMLTIVNWIFDYQPWKQTYGFDMRVLKGAWTYYHGLKGRLERIEKHLISEPSSHSAKLSKALITAQLREIERMTTSLDVVHYRCQLSERMF